MSQPHFEGSVRSPLTLPKMGLGSPPGLPKLQSLIEEVKTPHIWVFFISLERSWSVDVQNGLAWTIWTSTAQIMVEIKVGSQIGSLTPNHKRSGIDRFWCVQVECVTPLESSQQGLQVWFRPHPNQRLGREVMSAQSPESPNQDSFGTPLWESREKMPFGCKCDGET